MGAVAASWHHEGALENCIGESTGILHTVDFANFWGDRCVLSDFHKSIMSSSGKKVNKKRLFKINHLDNIFTV